MESPFSFAIHVFQKNFLNPLSYLQPPISDSSPLACYSWWMSTPRPIAGQPPQRSSPVGPRSDEGKAASRANSLKTGLYAYPRSSPANPLRKPKPISYNPNPLNKKLGSFLHFAYPGPHRSEPLPSTLEGPEPYPPSALQRREPLLTFSSVFPKTVTRPKANTLQPNRAPTCQNDRTGIIN
jgi:hypothetical protein